MSESEQMVASWWISRRNAATTLPCGRHKLSFTVHKTEAKGYSKKQPFDRLFNNL